MRLLSYIAWFVLACHCFGIEVTFRYVKTPNDDFVRVFVPGTMPSGTGNDWGPNSNGFIEPDAPSLMTYNEDTDCYERTYDLTIGQEYLYKFHFHFNNSGTNNSWIPDPLNSNTSSDGYDNSVLEVTDPLFFQTAKHLNDNNEVTGFSAGIFTQGVVDFIHYWIGGDTLSGLEFLNEQSVLYIPFNPPIMNTDQIWVQASIDGELYDVYGLGPIEIIEEPMPYNVVMGPNWVNDTMYLAVHAPGQSVMRVLVTSPGASANDSDAILMKKDPELEDIWWIELDLPNGQYEYEYLLSNGNRVIDPLSRILTNGRTRIEIGPGGVTTADDYVWNSNDFIRPSLDTLIIYELHIDDFSAQGNGQGTFLDLVEKLDYLKSTGINAIELMPITEFPGSHSWGYDPLIMSAVDDRYGTPEDFKYFIDEAHSRGIAVIMDIIWNHIRSSGPLWQIQPDFDLNPYIKRSNELNPNESEGSWGFQDLDHFNYHTINYVNQVNHIWIEEYRVDGFRFDATRHIGWQLSQPDFGITAWSAQIEQTDPTIYQIAEHLPSDPWLIEATSLHAAWHDSFHDVLKSDAHGQYNSATTFMNQVVRLHEYSNVGNAYSNRNEAVKFMNNHDEQSILQEMVVFNNYSIDEARHRDRFYANILFTSLGVPMIFQGQEFGLQTGWDDDNNNGNYDEEKLQYRPIDWSLLDTEEGTSHLSHYAKLIKFRKRNPVFAKGTFYDLWRYEAERVIVYGYKDESEGNEDNQVIVIANFSEYDRTVEDVPFLSLGTWHDIMNPENTLVVDNMNLDQYFIEGKTAIIYANQQWNLDISKVDITSNSYNLLDSYPNPFNANILISLEINRLMSGSLKVYDINGRVVKTLKHGLFAQGQYNFQWDSVSDDGISVSSGVYFISFQSDNGILNNKVLLVK